MEGKRDTSAGYRKQKRNRVGILLILFFLVFLVGTVGFGLTEAKEEKAQKISEKKPKEEKSGCEYMETNPLQSAFAPEVTDAVEVYYDSLKDEKEFVESYDHMQVYTKLGKYKDTYVAFVRYDMKIRDIYTEVPGLSTVYVTKDENGICQVSAKAEDDEVASYIQKIAQHEDVQALISETQQAYQEAVQSDALLQEALSDLKDAYENSTGS